MPSGGRAAGRPGGPGWGRGGPVGGGCCAGCGGHGASKRPWAPRWTPPPSGPAPQLAHHAPSQLKAKARKQALTHAHTSGNFNGRAGGTFTLSLPALRFIFHTRLCRPEGSRGSRLQAVPQKGGCEREKRRPPANRPVCGACVVAFRCAPLQNSGEAVRHGWNVAFGKKHDSFRESLAHIFF